MKKIYLTIFALTIAVISFGQAVYNPFTQNIHFSPEPNAFGIQNCGDTDVDFTFGLTTASDADSFATSPLKIDICVEGFILREVDPALAVYGKMAKYFTWSIDTARNCVIGVQSDTLHGSGFTFPLDTNVSGLIAVKLQIPANLAVPSTAKIDVSLEVPDYMKVGNDSTDDDESVQTQNYIGVTSARGTLYIDDSLGNIPYGTASGIPDNYLMYINVVDSATGLVEDNALIDTNGTYYVDSLTVNRSYVVQLSTMQGVNGQTPPPVQLPPKWGWVDEGCCDSITNDGNANGTLTGIRVTTCPIIYADYGISKTVFLAVNDLDFKVSEKDCNSVLNWNNTSMEGIARFEILRRDASVTNYVKIGELKAVPNAAADYQYSYVDKNEKQENKVYYYQLKIIDRNESMLFSPIKTIALNCSGANSIATIFPNPATDKVHFLYDNQTGSEAIRIVIMDVAGKTIYKEVQDISPSYNEFTFDIADYPAGYYLMKYEDLDSDQSGTLKFTIK